MFAVMGEETTRCICTVNHTKRSRGKPPYKAVCLGHEHDTDPADLDPRRQAMLLYFQGIPRSPHC